MTAGTVDEQAALISRAETPIVVWMSWYVNRTCPSCSVGAEAT